ncbi:hypothetical protein D3C73_1078210 [compost metagenome]
MAKESYDPFCLGPLRLRAESGILLGCASHVLLETVFACVQFPLGYRPAKILYQTFYHFESLIAKFDITRKYPQLLTGC